MKTRTLSFPDMFDRNSVRVLEGVEGIKSNLSLILQCEKREQLGDPDFGTSLHKTKFSKNTALAKELATDGILESQKFMNSVIFNRDDVSIVKTSPGTIDIKVSAIFSEAVNKRDLVVIEGVSLNE